MTVSIVEHPLREHIFRRLDEGLPALDAMPTAEGLAEFLQSGAADEVDHDNVWEFRALAIEFLVSVCVEWLVELQYWCDVTGMKPGEFMVEFGCGWCATSSRVPVWFLRKIGPPRCPAHGPMTSDNKAVRLRLPPVPRLRWRADSEDT
jgi:hypothetical protein